jgi:hypothetical protein
MLIPEIAVICGQEAPLLLVTAPLQTPLIDVTLPSPRIQLANEGNSELSGMDSCLLE